MRRNNGIRKGDPPPRHKDGGQEAEWGKDERGKEGKLPFDVLRVKRLKLKESDT